MIRTPPLKKSDWKEYVPTPSPSPRKTRTIIQLRDTTMKKEAERKSMGSTAFYLKSILTVLLFALVSIHLLLSKYPNTVSLDPINKKKMKETDTIRRLSFSLQEHSYLSDRSSSRVLYLRGARS